MNHKLLAPPKFRPRTFAIIHACIAGLAIVMLGALSLSGVRGASELWKGSLVIVALHTVATAAYARVIAASARIPSERMPLVHWVVFFINMLACFGTFGVLFFGSAVRGVREQSAMIAMMSGFMLVQCGWGRRVGESRHCPGCEYEFGFTDENDAPIRCPECGTGWLGRLKKGRRVRSVRLMVFGAVSGVVAAVVCNPIFYLAAVSPRLATPALFAALFASPGSGYTAWTELATRPLEPAWTTVMARKVLSVRRESNWNDGGASEWFEAMVATGQIPAELVERFYNESFVADLKGPSRVKAGEAFTVSLSVRHAVGGFRNQLGVLFAGYAVDDAPPLAGRSFKTLWKHDLAPMVLTSSRDVLPVSMVAPDVQEFRVRAVFWVVYQPSFTDELGWQSDGTPVAPKAALWMERRELVKTIRVIR